MRLRPYILPITLTIQLAGCASLPPAPFLPGRTDPATQSFIAAALAMRGAPYRYGGESPNGFDCSGLVAYAAKQAGVQVPRTAREQLQSGIPVKRRSLQPGDLVFMRLRKELHVGIVTGDGVFVHAPSKGGKVRVDQLDAQPYRDGFVAARRIQP